MTVLVGGATGFTGKRVLPLLKANGPIRVFARCNSDTSLAVSLGMEVAVGDYADVDSLTKALQGCSGFINCGSLGFGHAQNLVDACRKANVQRALFLSTTAIFTNLAAPSKKIRIEAEKIIQTSGLDWTILRPTMIFGDVDDRNMIRLLKFLKRSPFVLIPGSGNSLQRPIYVEDLAHAIVAAFFNSKTIRKSYNLSGAKPLSFNEVIESACESLHVKRIKIHLPVAPLRLVAKILEKLSKKPWIKEEQILRLLEDKAFDHDKAKADFSFNPLDYKSAIQKEVMKAKLGQG